MSAVVVPYTARTAGAVIERRSGVLNLAGGRRRIERKVLVSKIWRAAGVVIQHRPETGQERGRKLFSTSKKILGTLPEKSTLLLQAKTLD